MLLSNGRRRSDVFSEQDSIHNYYEKLVIEQAVRADDRAAQDSDFLSDVTCLALNKLPPRYVRHDVDMTFYLTSEEMDGMINKVVQAVNEAISYLDEKSKEDDA
jgi:hypothetical protein